MRKSLLLCCLLVASQANAVDGYIGIGYNHTSTPETTEDEFVLDGFGPKLRLEWSGDKERYVPFYIDVGIYYQMNRKFSEDGDVIAKIEFGMNFFEFKF